MIENRYKTFANRFLAGIIDGLIFIPFFIIGEMFFADKYTSQLWLNLSETVLYTVYVVVGHGKYGQTIGKKVMKIKVLDLEESNLIGYKRAIIRESIWILISLSLSVYFIMDSDGASLNGQDEIARHDNISTMVSFAWLAAELITMLTNNKRRALHDFMAGSVVINLKKA
jgi:uncharacterized RDD family membrane protein YckC